ncbi:ABC transporter permease [Pedobacter frigoris]|uniref:FtsX-like permease family protein n=1 Tax=Pedobacter frigoris TaxID=2571272 RepID=A0A4U1CN19_9SPHI|nr:ABC transporter permease [Pedobacter frigoris]TKC08874.1 FtsX-like permease family protein [Pedobacter frigoris]
MFRINLKIAFRNIWKNRLTASIKLFGLIAGLASVVLLVAYVLFELSYDRHNLNADRIYRLHVVQTDGENESIHMPSGMVEMMKQEIPEVEEGTYLSIYETPIQVDRNMFKVKILRTTASFFDLFTVPLKEGADRNTVLKEPKEALVSAAFAKQAFPGQSAIGKTISLNLNSTPYLISGIIGDIPKASHFHGDILVKSNLKQVVNWRGYTSAPQYILLKKGTSPATVLAKMKSLYKKYQFPEKIALKLMPLTDIHLHSHTSGELEPNSDIKYIYIFSIVASLILLIAVVNFINLTVAASLKRSKEIGVKKVLGASMQQLKVQFLSESYIYFIAATFVVFLIIMDLIPLLGNRLGINITFSEVFNLKMIGISLTIIVLSGFIAAFYPAMVLSRMMPADTLKGYTGHIPGKGGFKKFLVVFQFAISALLMVCTMVIYSQLKYISNKNLGFDKDQVLVTSYNMLDNRFTGFKEALLKEKGVKSLSISTFNPGVSYGGTSSWTNDGDTTKYEMEMVYCDLDFMKTLDIKVLKGRSFSEATPAELKAFNTEGQGLTEKQQRELEMRNPILLNEAAAKSLNIKNVDTLLLAGGLQGKVIGVVTDFNGMSLHNKVKPVALYLQPKTTSGYTYVKMETDDLPATRKTIEALWKKHFPDVVTEFQFLDQYLEKLYVSEMRLGSIFIVFAGMAIFLCCIGLFGIVYYELEQKTKEIAIRKVLGASLNDLLTLMNKNFVIMVLIANVIIWPIAYLLINKWLSTFYYRISLSYWPFVWAMLICLVLTILTVSLKALSTIKKSPVDTLKYE